MSSLRVSDDGMGLLCLTGIVVALLIIVLTMTGTLESVYAIGGGYGLRMENVGILILMIGVTIGLYRFALRE